LSQLAVRADGLPVAFVMRGALGCASIDDASAFLRGVAHASGQNYQLADRTGIATLECSAGGAASVAIANGRSLHTNHPLASRDSRVDETRFAGSPDSRARLESLRADLGGLAPEHVDADAVRAALAACRPQGAVSIVPPSGAPITESMTMGAIVSEVADAVSVSVCPGPPSREAWRSISL
jgi:hypothetical protein